MFARRDDAHERYLRAADEVGKRVLETQGDGDAADAERCDERRHVHAEAGVEHEAGSDAPHDATHDVHEDGALGDLVAILAHDMA